MIENPMDVLAQFPVRKSKKQKQSFRDSVQSYAKGLGYECAVEKGSLGARNVVIGNPETAKCLVTAHYDTPACMVVPNLITPCNFWTFMGYQLAVTVLVFTVALIPMLILKWFGADQSVLSLVWLMTLYAILGLMMLGPANKHNANDNTSGVVTVLETAKALPENLRDKVCFVLFDLEEAGLIGSSSYRKAHKKATESQIILNCDCVGDGNELMMFPMKKVKKDEKLMESLRSICRTVGEKNLSVREKGFSYYPSDQKNFPYGVGIAAFNRSKWVGLYCDKIHTGKDTVLDEENVSILRDSILDLIRAV